MLVEYLREAPYWLGWLLVLLVIGASIYVGWKAWFGDRSRGRRRCPKCWYDLAYTDGMTCSECGHVARNEADFSRTRRRWVKGFLAMLLATVVILLVREQTVQSGWAGVVPSRALVWSLPLFSDTNNDAVKQLLKRMNKGQLSEGNLRRLIERCAKGDGGSHTGTAPWAQKYGSLLNRLRPALAARRKGNELYDLEIPLLDIPPLITLQAREHWPVGSSARVGVQVVNWWPYGSDSRLRITPLFDGAETETVYFRGLNSPNTAYSVLTPPLDADDEEIVIEVEAMRRTTELSDEWSSIVTRILSVPVSVDDDIEKMITPLSDPQMDAALKRSMVGAVKFIDGPRALRLYVSPRVTAIAEFDDVAIGFISEIIHDGKVVLLDHTWWMGGQNVSDRGFGSWSDDPNMDALMAEDLTEGEWLLHVKSDPMLAIRAGEASNYWNGEFTITMPVQLRPRTAPEPHWWMEEEELPDDEREEN